MDNNVFNMRVVLMWIVNVFPAMSSLSSWSGQGYKACLTCNKDTPSIQVIGKEAYIGHRRFLPRLHPLRNNKHIDGKTERRQPPRRLSVIEIIDQLNQVRPQLPGKMIVNLIRNLPVMNIINAIQKLMTIDYIIIMDVLFFVSSNCITLFQYLYN